MKRLLLLVPLLLALGFSAVFAQEDTSVSTAEDPELGTYLTDGEGMTLYMFTQDEANVSVCYDQCAENWPPFTAEEPLSLPDGVPGELALTTRTDGTQQVTYNTMPLYYWVEDMEPGDTTGHGVGDVWFVVNPSEPGATPSASPAASPVAMTADTTVATSDSPELGTYLTDAEGMTLYLFTNDEQGSGSSVCNDDCATNWPPFSAEEPLTLPEGVPGELTLITRDDGSQQVAYNGWPLYYWVNDEAPGDTTGHEVGDVWYVVNPAEPDAMATPGS